MKKGFRTVLLLSACLVLLAGCASEPKTQYNVNTQGAANTQADPYAPAGAVLHLPDLHRVEPESDV